MLTEEQRKQLEEREIHKFFTRKMVDLKKNGLGNYLEFWTRKLIELDEEVIRLKNETDEKKRKWKSLKEKLIEDWEKLEESSKLEIKELERKNNNLANEFRNEKGKYEEKILEKIEKILELKEKLKEQVITHQNRIKDKDLQITKLQTQGEELEKWKKELQKDIKKDRERKNRIVKKLEAEWIGILTKTLQQGRKKIKKLKERILEQDQKLHKSNDQIIEYAMSIGIVNRKYNQLEEQKKKVDTRLRNARENSRRLVRDKEKGLKELEVKKDNVVKLEQELTNVKRKLDYRNKKIVSLASQRDRARKKLKTLKDKQQKLAQQAQNKQVSVDLIKYKNITNSFFDPNDKTLVQAVEETFASLINVIANAQRNLGVQDLSSIAISHPLPKGKNLKDLIDFYNSTPPQPGNNQPTIITQTREIDREIKVEVDKIIEVESKEQKKEIVRLKNIIKELEGNLSQHNCERIVVPDRKSNNNIILVICLILLTLVLTSQIILTKKKKNKVNSRTTEVVYYNGQK